MAACILNFHPLTYLPSIHVHFKPAAQKHPGQQGAIQHVCIKTDKTALKNGSVFLMMINILYDLTDLSTQGRLQRLRQRWFELVGAVTVSSYWLSWSSQRKRHMGSFCL